MIQGKLVNIKNVIEAENCIKYLLQRPKLEMVGLGLLYGKPGLGKTTYANRIAFSRGYIYIRLESTTTPKSFAYELLTKLYHRYNLGDYIPSGTSNSLFKRVLSILEDHEDAVIIIDEIDYAFQMPKLLGAIRDIVDETLAIVILVGMQSARTRLLQINEYYFDRCNIFYEFEPVSKQDIGALCKEILDIKCHNDLIDYIHFHTCGNMRKTMKMLHTIEQVAVAKNLTKISVNDLNPE